LRWQYRSRSTTHHLLAFISLLENHDDEEEDDDNLTDLVRKGVVGFISWYDDGTLDDRAPLGERGQENYSTRLSGHLFGGLVVVGGVADERERLLLLLPQDLYHPLEGFRSIVQ